MSSDSPIIAADMLSFLRSIVHRKKITEHHIESMNALYEYGIAQIIKNIFSIQHRFKNARSHTEDDRAIDEIEFTVNFTGIDLSPPRSVDFRTGVSEPLYPNQARLNSLTYSTQLSVDVSMTKTKYLKAGGSQTSTEVLKNHRIAAIPCMVGSSLCSTASRSKLDLIRLEEDPHDEGGYFIVHGGEWSIDCLENVPWNSYRLTKETVHKELARGVIMSKLGDGFENSFQLLVQYMNDGAIVLTMQVADYSLFTIPFYIMFRILGVASDREIVDSIVGDSDATDPLTRALLALLDKAYSVHDAAWAPIRYNTDPSDIVQFMALKLNSKIAQNTRARRDENVMRYINTTTMDVIDKHILPHLGEKPAFRGLKALYIGYLINKLLLVMLDVINVMDRDSLKNKRIHAAGTSLFKAFKIDFNHAVIHEVRKKITNAFKNNPFDNVHMAEIVAGAVKPEELERMLVQSITAGNKPIKIHKTEVKNRIASQILYRKNDGNTKSVACTLSVANAPANKQNERADEIRRVHSTFTGFIDVSHSPDSGVKVGMVKQIAVSASITHATNSQTLRQHLLNDPNLIRIANITPVEIARRRLSRVFVNGNWIGCVENDWEFVAHWRAERRKGAIDRKATIFWETHLREVFFWCDVGRIIRPMVIVYNNLEKFDAACMAAHKDPKKKYPDPTEFKQWITLTKEHLHKLRDGVMTVDDLVNEGVVEYVSGEESENLFIAPNIDTFRAHEHDVLRRYTHCDIEQAIFGLISLASPLANHSNAVRITMWTCQRKQSCAWFALNWPFRMDRGTILQYYCEKPLISCFADEFLYPNGHNAIVALCLHGGFNQEDSLQVNMSSVQRGLFNGSYFNYEQTKLEKDESFEAPQVSSRTIDRRSEAIYDYCENGFAKVGSVVHKGYVLIAKTARLPKSTEGLQYSEKSVTYKWRVPAHIERVVVGYDDKNQRTARVRYRQEKNLIRGDKCSSRTGNKGIVGRLVPACDMPFSEDGLVPDILVNAHSIPTRRALNQIIECLLGMQAARLGCHIDATSFLPIDIESAMKAMEAAGFKHGGYRRMYNGLTGDWIDTLIFMGPMTYQRLQKFADSESYAIRHGPTAALTKQPIHGKTNDGSFKVGEMEKDCLIAHGTLRALREKFYDDSDGTMIYICRRCGNRAIYNGAEAIYNCRKCQDLSEIVAVPSSWAANLLMNEVSSMNVKMTMGIAPHTFQRPEGTDPEPRR